MAKLNRFLGVFLVLSSTSIILVLVGIAYGCYAVFGTVLCVGLIIIGTYLALKG